MHTRIFIDSFDKLLEHQRTTTISSTPTARIGTMAGGCVAGQRCTAGSLPHPSRLPSLVHDYILAGVFLTDEFSGDSGLAAFGADTAQFKVQSLSVASQIVQPHEPRP